MIATFGGGCFWCTEIIFLNTLGVEAVTPGYMGGRNENPSYEEVCTGETGHVEVVQIKYDEQQVSYQDLLNIFFKTHDPTTLNQQGGDVGTQYRSVVFYHDEQQQTMAQEMIAGLNAANIFVQPIVTAVEEAVVFWPAEDYHVNYFNRNPENPFCAAVIAPKLSKFLKNYSSQ